MNRIEIIGLPGAGKTSLASAARAQGLLPLHEQYRANPFWAKAMSGDTASWFASDIVFHLQHMQQIRYADVASRLHIADFSIWQDAFYASRRSTSAQSTVYEALHQYVRSAVGEPVAYIFLDLSADELMQRVASRGRPEEEGIQLVDVAAAVDGLRSAVGTQLASQGKTVLTYSTAHFEPILREVRHFVRILQSNAE